MVINYEKFDNGIYRINNDCEILLIDTFCEFYNMSEKWKKQFNDESIVLTFCITMDDILILFDLHDEKLYNIENGIEITMFENDKYNLLYPILFSLMDDVLIRG